MKTVTHIQHVLASLLCNETLRFLFLSVTTYHTNSWLNIRYAAGLNCAWRILVAELPAVGLIKVYIFWSSLCNVHIKVVWPSASYFVDTGLRWFMLLKILQPRPQIWWQALPVEWGLWKLIPMVLKWCSLPTYSTYDLILCVHACLCAFGLSTM